MKLKLLMLVIFWLPVFSQAQPINVFVSILPQKYFVEQIAKDYADVKVMVKPGQSPETFEPSMKLMSALAEADIYFTIGMPFEKIWTNRVMDLNPKLVISDTQADNNLLVTTGNNFDPHSWLSPELASKQAQIIYRQLSILRPELQALFKENVIKLEQKFQQLDQFINNTFNASNNRRFMVFHPAFSYFSQRYKLQQIAIETDGKEPGTKQLAQLISRAQKDGVKYILAEKEFSQETAKAIARSINAQVIVLDPLAEDYFTNMKVLTHEINKSLY